MLDKARSAICIAALTLASTAFAVSPKSTTYSFEYVAVGIGGGISASNTYTLAAYADDTGSAGVSTSEHYSIEPVVGAPDNTPNAAVERWSLYE